MTPDDAQIARLLSAAGSLITLAPRTFVISRPLSLLNLWCLTDLTNPDDGCKRIRITGNVFASPGRNCISVIHGSDVLIDGNDFYDANGLDPACAVDLEPNQNEAPGITRDVTITNNRVRNCRKGIAVQGMVAGMTGVVIQGNRVDGCEVAGIYCEASGAVVKDNVCRGSKGWDLNVSNADCCTITNNVTDKLYADNIGHGNAVGHTIEGNVGQINTQYAVLK
jgi:hypothetical protein